jgi:hypothetical protein
LAKFPRKSDRAGNEIEPTDIAIRMTRPDHSRLSSGHVIYRYKTLRALALEAQYTVHAAIHGLAPICYAIHIYPVTVTSSKGQPKKLYGALYFMRRGKVSLAQFLDNSNLIGQTPASAGRSASAAILPLLAKQAKAGVVNFDIKPGNLLLTHGSANMPWNAHSIDFDANMYAVRFGEAGTNSEEWQANLLVNLVLLSSHLRCFYAKPVCDGWIECVRPLILTLLTSAKTTRWPYLARTRRNAVFCEMTACGDASCKARFEMMATLYFCNHNANTTPFRPICGTASEGLIFQLVRYVLNLSSSEDII